jgi:RNA polymerase sigma factor (sigma-70 family)
MPEAPEKLIDGVHLLPVEGPTLKPIVLTQGEPRSLGRTSGCSVVLTEATVSREHATVVWTGSLLEVTDLGSRTGTWVNTIRIEANEPIPLRSGDVVAIGPWRFLARFPGDDDGASHDVPDVPSIDRSSKVNQFETGNTIFLQLKADGSAVRELGWNDFVEKYSRIILGFARNAGLPSQEADDVLQDVLLGFFRVHEQFEYDPAKGRFRGYLKRITLNAIRARYRRKRPDDHIPSNFEAATEDDIDAAWDRQWTEQILRQALDVARSEFRTNTFEAFQLYGRRGLASDVVAEQLDMTPDAVRHAKMRVMKRVRAIVQELRSEEG